jgi:hypothetical protein
MEGGIMNYKLPLITKNMPRENLSIPNYIRDTAESWRQGKGGTYDEWEKRKRREAVESSPEAQAAREESLK